MDDLDKIIYDTIPTVKDDLIYKLCYEVFISTDKGKILLAELFKKYVHRPFTNLLSDDPEIDTNKILGKAIQRDFVQMLLLKAQQYESSLKKS